MPNNKDSKIHTGELVDTKKIAESPPRQTLLGTLFESRRWLWLSQLWTKQTVALHGLVKAESELAEAYKERRRKIEDLRNIQPILNADEEARKATEFEAKVRREQAERAYRERFQDNTISQKRKDQEIKRLDIEEERINAERQEAEIRRLENEKRLQALKKDLAAGAEAKQPVKKRRTTISSAKLKEIDKVVKWRNEKIKDIDASKDTEASKEERHRAVYAEEERQKELIEEKYKDGL